MKHILFLCLVLAACIANSQVFTTQIVDDQQPQSSDPNLQIVITDKSTTEAKAVEDCTQCSLTAGRTVSKSSQALASVQQTGKHLERVIAEEGWQSSCDGFVKDGKIGLYGQIVREEIMKPAALKNIKQGDEDLARLCPSYPVMNNSSKANVILLVITSMAFEESSCNNEKSARGPNGVAKGFFQLHAGQESSYSPDCEDFDSNTPRGSITCALKTLNTQMGKGNMFRQEDNYWDVLRPMRYSKKTKSYFPNPSYAQIRSAISSFGPCGDKTEEVDSTKLAKQFSTVMGKKFFQKVAADN
ncbi:hypothetical protein CIK05_04575 [Bdellovibrio sp. qaytius]|nr:hypothetical protein CIK05_04575 [Bdellovibrio sp. qaytius]